MDEFMKQYGGAIIVVIAIIALCVLVTTVIGGDVVKSAFETLVQNFFTKVSSKAGLE